MGSIRLFALGFFQNNDPVDLDSVDLDPELPIHLTGHPSKDHSAGPMVGRKERFRIEYPLLGCVRSLFLTRYLRSTLNEVSGVTPKADSQGPVKCPVKSARVESAHGRPMKRLQERQPGHRGFGPGAVLADVCFDRAEVHGPAGHCPCRPADQGSIRARQPGGMVGFWRRFSSAMPSSSGRPAIWLTAGMCGEPTREPFSGGCLRESPPHSRPAWGFS